MKDFLEKCICCKNYVNEKLLCKTCKKILNIVICYNCCAENSDKYLCKDCKKCCYTNTRFEKFLSKYERCELCMDKYILSIIVKLKQNGVK